MATHAPTTSRRELLALLGSTPALAIPVVRRPTSFDDALAQYHAARGEADAFARAMRGTRPDRLVEGRFDALINETLGRAQKVFETPAPTVAALADKLQVMLTDGDFGEDGHLLHADAARLGDVL